ncbi:MAG: thiamine-binding protein [Thermoprotei archaeon]|nr:MAG: thiamine-binding protein [Thermoprotei archaeon]
MPVVVEISIVPIGVGSSLSKYVAEALEILRKYNIKYVLAPSCTIFEEINVHKALKIVAEIHEKVLEKALRVLTLIKIDERRNRSEWSLEYKVESAKRKLGEEK